MFNINFNPFAGGAGGQADPNFFRYFIDQMDSLNSFSAQAIFSSSHSFQVYNPPAADTLAFLNLSYNNFAGSLELDSFLTVVFPSLTHLDVSGNSFNTLVAPPSLPNAVFEQLHIGGNMLQDFKPFETLLNNIPSLQKLYATNAMDTTGFANDLLELNIADSLPNLIVLDISHNLLAGNFPPDVFEDMPNIIYLLLNDNHIEGYLPNPTTVISNPPVGNAQVYALSKLQRLNISNNNLYGDLRMDWILGAQLAADFGNLGVNTPLRELFAQGNAFRAIKPQLNDPQAVATLGIIFNQRFPLLERVSVANNRFDFKDLFRLQKILRLKQINLAGQDHYVPQAEVLNDVSAFQYAPQAELGIGGVRRQRPNRRIVIEAGKGIEEDDGTNTNYISNRYKWLRIDTAGIVGGTAAAPVIDTLGLTEQIADGIAPALSTNNTNYTAATEPTFLIGVDTTSGNTHKIGIDNLNATTHGDYLYQGLITNNNFPFLELKTVRKKVEVGNCSDDSDANVWCQSMIVQFHPDTLALLTPAQQDSMKLAIRTEMGAVPIEVCLCGDIELWGISDTASAMLEAFGKGTKEATTTASARPQLLSADPNYNLLSGTSNSLPDTVNLPAGSGNTTASTLVAIIDSGVDYEYPALVPYLSEGPSSVSACMPNAIWGYSFLDDSNNATDDHGHGTAVAGIVAGISQQSILPDTGSMATDIGILPLKYTNKSGAGSLFNAACALRYAADYERTTSGGGTAKVRVINTSWGYYGDPCMVLENVITYVGEDCGILIVASAGNDGIMVEGNDTVRHWPSNSIWDPSNSIAADNVLSVAGVGQYQDSLHASSNWGSVHIDVAAPWHESSTQAGSTNGFAPVQGTSFAAPQVARAAALLFDKYPDATYWAVKYALMNGVDVLQHPDSLKLLSKGRINYHKADSILSIILDRTICSNSITIGVDEIAHLGEYIKVYPNPVNDNLTIEMDYTLDATKMSLNLFNVHGQLLYQQQLQPGTRSTHIPTGDLPTGIYFMQVELDNRQFSTKIIKR